MTYIHGIELEKIEPILKQYLLEKKPEFETCKIEISTCYKNIVKQNRLKKMDGPLNIIDYSNIQSSKKPINLTEFKEELSSLWSKTSDDYKIIIEASNGSSFTIFGLGGYVYSVIYQVWYSDAYKATHIVNKQYEALKIVMPITKYDGSFPNYINAKVTNFEGNFYSNGYYFDGVLDKFFNLLTNDGEKRYEKTEKRSYNDWQDMEPKDPVKLSEQDRRKYKLSETNIELPWVVMDQNGVPVIDVDGKKTPNFELKVVKKRTKLGQFSKRLKHLTQGAFGGKRNTRICKRNTRIGKKKKVYKNHSRQHTRKRKFT